MKIYSIAASILAAATTCTNSSMMFAYAETNNNGGNAPGAGNSNAITCLPEDIGLLITSSNAEDGNELLVYCRAPDGTVDFGGAISTGGDGGFAGGPDRSTGSILDPLGSNHPVTLSQNEKCLLVVNAGSDTVTSFAIGEDLHVQRVGEYKSGGQFPVSIATKDGLAYVLNAGGEGNLVSFDLDEERCTLREIDGTSRSLEFDHTSPPSLAVSPASIKLTPDQQRIVLTIKGVNQGLIIVYQLDEFGIPGRGTYTVSSGFQPFSIDFDSNGNLLVVEENGAAPQPPAFTQPPPRAGAVSSYRFTDIGTLEPLSRSVPNHQSAPCWSTIHENCLYTGNVVSGSLSSYTVDENGEVTLSAESEAAVPGAIDLYVQDGILYALSALDRSTRTQPAIYSFRLSSGGTSCALQPLGVTFEGLPSTVITQNGVTGLTAVGRQ